jgi:hypothetical protein
MVCSLGLAAAQIVNDAALELQLKQVFPDAASFSGKEGNPPHYKAFGPARDGQDPELIGYAYWTTELEPLERGYDGPIKMLVGMSPTGALTRIIVSPMDISRSSFPSSPSSSRARTSVIASASARTSTRSRVRQLRSRARVAPCAIARVASRALTSRHPSLDRSPIVRIPARQSPRPRSLLPCGGRVACSACGRGRPVGLRRSR